MAAADASLTREDFMQLKVIVKPGEDRGFVARVRALRGCWSQGSTRDEAVANVREAIAGWLEAEQDKSDGIAAVGEVELVDV